MKKTNKKLASAIVLGLMLTVPVGVSAAEVMGSIDTSQTKEDSLVINSDKKVDFTNGTDAAYGIYAKDGVDIKLTGDSVTVNSDTGACDENRAVYVATNGNVELGNTNSTIQINSTGFSGMGMTAIGTGSSLTVKGKDLIVNVTGEYGFGIHVQNNTQDAIAPEHAAKINIEADNILVNSTSLGLSAFSNGQMNVNGNLVVNAENAIDVRGNSTVNINTDGKHSTVLNGDIVFETPNSPDDAQNSGNIINANVNINFAGEDSSFTGRVYQMYKGDNGEAIDSVELNTPPYYGNVTEMKMQFNNGAAWNMTGDSFVNNVTLNNGGTINVQEDVTKFNAEDVSMNNGIIDMQGSGQFVNVNNLDGTGVVNTNSLDNKMTISDVTDASLTVNGNGTIADAIYQDSTKAQDLAKVVVTSGGTTAADKVTTDEGIIAGRYEFDVDEDGKVDTANGSYTKNTKNEAISNMASISLMAWRAENNDMNKRLGELRNSKGEHGVWARMVRGESEYGAQSIKNVYNTYQLGYDEKLSTNDHWTVGAAISYTDGQSSFDNGSGENTSKGLSFYGSYLGDNGEFVDLIAKYARLDNEFDVAGGVGSGDYSTNGYSFSAEYGKRTQLANDFYIEPQVELTYGRVADVDFVTKNGAKVSQDSMDSLVGRVGLAAGKNIKNGNVYVRASYLYDFDGETNVTFSNAGASESFSEDLGGGWFEFGIGTNINLSDATYLYLDVEKTTGGEVDTNWQWNAGVRYSF